MRHCNVFSVLLLSFCGLLVIEPAGALDLRMVTKDLYYECRTEMAAGLYKDIKSGKIKATIFQVDPSDRWEMKLVKLKSQEDLQKVPLDCGLQREKRDTFPLFSKDRPEFCKVETYGDEGFRLVTAEHCHVTGSLVEQRYNAIECGIGSTSFFDSDRLFGIDGDNRISAFGDSSVKLIRSARVSKFIFERLDR